MKSYPRTTLFAALFLAACSTYDLQGLSLVSPVSFIVVGDTTTLSVVTLEGSVEPATGVSWTSSDEAVATVDSEGLVLGHGPGSVVLRARTNDYDLEVPLLVLEVAGPFQALTVGADHTCGIDDEGDSWCWGRNEHGQLGTTNPPDPCSIGTGIAIPCAVAAIRVAAEPFTDLVGGWYHNCGLTTAGAAYCWGLNNGGQLGDGGTASGPNPLPVAGGHRFQSLAAKENTTCGIRDDNALMCWGGDVLAPARMAGDLEFTTVAPGRTTCAIATDDATWCWGTRGRGQLGVPEAELACDSLLCLDPQRVDTEAVFVDLAVGYEFACGLTEAGVAWCWGANDLGQLGDGTNVDRSEPMPTAGGHIFEALRADREQVCGTTTGGPMRCWGRGAAGFGAGSASAQADVPTLAAPDLHLVETAIGFSTQCGFDTLGLAWCWGGNGWGQVGNGLPQQAAVLFPARVVRHPDYS